MMYIVYVNGYSLNWVNEVFPIDIWHKFECSECVWMVPGTEVE